MERGLQHFALLGKPGVDLRIQPCDLGAQFAEALGELRSQFSGTLIEVCSQFGGTLSELRLEPDRVLFIEQSEIPHIR